MTKEKLLKLIELFGSFWYVSNYYCPCYGQSWALWFKEAPASDVDRFDDLINKCVEYPYGVDVNLVDWRLILMDDYYRWFEGRLYPSDKEGCMTNYPPDVIYNIVHYFEK